MKRIITIIMAVSILACIAVPISAFEALDYNDYVDYIVVDGENDICTISFPVEWAYMSVKNLDSGSYYFTGYDNSVVLEAPDDDGTGNQGYLGNIEIDLFPLGAPFSFYAVDASYNGRFLDMSNIPGGATFSMVMSYGIMVESSYDKVTPYYTRFTRGDIYNSGLTATKVDVTHSASDTTFLQYISVTGDFEELAKGWTCGFRGRWDMTEEVIFNFALERLEVTFSISALYRMQEKMDTSNELLAAVEQKLGEQNEMLDDYINGSVDSVEPDNSDSVTDFTDKEQAILDKTEQGLTDFGTMVDSWSTNIADLVGAFVFLSAVFNLFTYNTPISFLFTASLSLGVCGLLFNLLDTAMDKSGGSSVRRTRSGQKALPRGRG